MSMDEGIYTYPNTIPETGYTIMQGATKTVAHVPGTAGDPVLEERVLRAYMLAFSIWMSRQRKYGRLNIAATGAPGCFVRALDKLSRLRQVYVNNNKDDFTDETLEDTWLDLLNYAAMGYLCHKGQWDD